VRTACTMALQAIARGCLDDFKLHGRAAARGDVEALHAMRIALTRLRTAIRFFAPAVRDPVWTTLRRQATWLGRRSGELRDIDVALKRQQGKVAISAQERPWHNRRELIRRRLGQTLRSERYRRFIERLARQCQLAKNNSSWSGADPKALRAFSTRRLRQWHTKLVTKGRKLEQLGEHKRHRLRIRAKRYRYALEWSLSTLPAQRPVMRRQIAQAKRIQNALGKLNDTSTHIAQARSLRLEPLPAMVRLGRDKSQRRLLKAACDSFEKLRELKNAS
jgi:CHAD domain-containing protein